jgi:putative ABC transport system substrate-binding protein
MLRRTFVVAIGCTVVSCARIALAESTTKTWRIGHIYPGKQEAADSVYWDGFRDELRKLGYIEGQNLIIDYHYADGQIDRLPGLASELVAHHPDVIVAVATPAIAAAQRATSVIPIVMSPSTDPVGSGFVKSIAHPGGNITGLANMVGDSLGKAAELLHQALPSAKRIAVLMSLNPTHPRQYELFNAAAEQLGLTTVPTIAPKPCDLEQAFLMIKREKCDALFVLADATRSEIVPLAALSAIPAIYQTSAYVELGGLASYAADLKPVFRRAAHYVDKIFKGANPAEIPVEQPVIFELVLNLKTAAMLAITFPDSLIARADKVLE